jgi:hypothetical protein
VADKCTEGRLTPEERDEYEAPIRVGNFVAILQAKARRLLAEGHAGCVDRPIITPKKRRSKEYFIPDELPHADAFTDSFRARCASLAPLLPPQAPSLPRPTREMSHSEWLAILNDKHSVVDLAHSLCLPRGELKEKVSSMVLHVRGEKGTRPAESP